jgi:hypothetical protein
MRRSFILVNSAGMASVNHALNEVNNRLMVRIIELWLSGGGTDFAEASICGLRETFHDVGEFGSWSWARRLFGDRSRVGRALLSWPKELDRQNCR